LGNPRDRSEYTRDHCHRGYPSGGLPLSGLTVFNNEVLFTGLGELWVTNGTAAGTHEIPLDGTTSVGNLTVFNHDVLFSGLDAGKPGSVDHGFDLGRYARDRRRFEEG
jgi:hypothetical protein